jgi:hypothetical protein
MFNSTLKFNTEEKTKLGVFLHVLLVKLAHTVLDGVPEQKQRVGLIHVLLPEVVGNDLYSPDDTV